MKTIFECRFCGKRFSRTLKVSYIEIKCPKCGEYDVDVIGGENKADTLCPPLINPAKLKLSPAKFTKLRIARSRYIKVIEETLDQKVSD